MSMRTFCPACMLLAPSPFLHPLPLSLARWRLGADSPSGGFSRHSACKHACTHTLRAIRLRLDRLGGLCASCVPCACA
eukprot:1578630-Lingulodinium_polyedra.AAC.1